MFSLFCGPREEADPDDDEGIQYLDGKKASTFDTMETDGSSVDKNGESAGCESPLIVRKGTLIESGESSHLGKQSEMSEELIAREGVDEREAVPTMQIDDDSNGPGLASDLLVTDTVEGPDMPTHEDDKRKLENLDLRVVAATETTEVSGVSNIASSAIVVYQARAGLVEPGDEEEAGSVSIDEFYDPAEEDFETESIGVDVPLNEQEPGAAVVDVAICLAPDVESVFPDEAALATEDDSREVPAEETEITVTKSGGKETNATAVGEALDTVSSGVEAPGMRRVDDAELDHETGLPGLTEQLNEEKAATCINSADDPPEQVSIKAVFLGAVEPQGIIESDAPSSGEANRPQEPSKHEQPIEETEDAVPATEKLNNLEPATESEPSADTSSKSAELATIAPQLLLPVLDHGEGSQAQVDTKISSTPDIEHDMDAQPIGRLKSDETDETGSESFDDASSERSVRFADPLVTSSWDVPRIDSDDLEDLFYTAMDISK